MPIPLLDFHVHEADVAPGTLAVRNRYPGEPPPARGPFTVGLHPWRVAANRLDADLAAVAAGIRHPRCIALGECGIDHLCETPRADQARAFATQVELAAAADLPVILHCVKAWPEIIAARQGCRARRPWVVHNFRGKATLARDLVRHGFMLSFGTALLEAPTLRAALAATPPDRVFLETDDAPDADLAALLETAAAACHLAPAALRQRIFANFAALCRRT